MKETTLSFEANTLEEAYEKASAKLNCSITDLKSKVIQAPSNGFLGFFKKKAIIEVSYITTKKRDIKDKQFNIKVEDISTKVNDISKDDIVDNKILNNHTNHKENSDIFNNFYVKEKENIAMPIIKKDKDKIILEVKEGIENLFKNLCYNIELQQVSFWDDNTLYIEFVGDDSALLIGKEGYRYKALSYILFNWIHAKYGVMIRLEISKFLAQQEEAVKRYLEPVIETIKEEGFYKTKPLDGILVHIALTQLRAIFPDKYIAIKTNHDGQRYILINEYKKDR